MIIPSLRIIQISKWLVILVNKSPLSGFIPVISGKWIGLREHLQDNPMIFMGKSMVFC